MLAFQTAAVSGCSSYSEMCLSIKEIPPVFHHTYRRDAKSTIMQFTSKPPTNNFHINTASSKNTTHGNPAVRFPNSNSIYFLT